MAMNISPAGLALGFGRTGVAASGYGNNGTGAGDMLRGQVNDETDEEKLRRKLGLVGAAERLAGASVAVGQSPAALAPAGPTDSKEDSQ